MLAYVGRRLLYLVPIWFGLSVLAFLLGAVAPGDPVRVYFQHVHARPPTEAELDLLRAQFGLDQPLPVRYLDWVLDALQGDLGTSFITGEPVLHELISRLGPTLQLVGSAMAVALVISLPVGIIAAVHRNRLIDQGLRIGAILGASLPGYFLAYILIIIFSVQLGWLPSVGRGGFTHLLMPAFALGLGESAILARLMRSSLLEVLDENYVRAAYAKGVRRGVVLIRHGVGNALSAVVTEAGLTFGTLLAFSAIIEVIFAWPGIGRLILDATTQRDYPVIQGFVLFAGTVFVIINLVVDLLYVWLDPRVQFAGRRQRAEVS